MLIWLVAITMQNTANMRLSDSLESRADLGIQCSYNNHFSSEY